MFESFRLNTPELKNAIVLSFLAFPVVNHMFGLTWSVEN